MKNHYLFLRHNGNGRYDIYVTDSLKDLHENDGESEAIECNSEEGFRAFLSKEYDLSLYNVIDLISEGATAYKYSPRELAKAAKKLGIS